MAEEEGEFGSVGGAIDVPRTEALADLHEQRVPRVVGDVGRQPRPRARDAVLLEERVGDVLVAHRRAHVEGRCEQQRRLQRVPMAREDALVDVRHRHDEAHVVLGDEGSERRHVARIVDPGHERHVIGVVERGCEAVAVGCDRRRPRAAERGDDVDALTGAGEENCGHGRRG